MSRGINSPDAVIAHNVAAHDKAATNYDRGHGEIFSEIEQSRLAAALAEATRLVTVDGSRSGLDVGCGTGNVTKHLLDLGFAVTAADVSERMLARVREKFAEKPGLTTHLLDGKDLAAFSDGQFDFVGAYSVLHHVPDYLGLVREMARVTAPGGIVFIDHESSPDYWSQPAALKAWKLVRRLGGKSDKRGLSKLFRRSYWRRRWQKLKNPRYQKQGDVHVWQDDHVEWDLVMVALQDCGCEIVSVEDYLNFRTGYSVAAYEKYSAMCNDTRRLVARKPSLNE